MERRDMTDNQKKADRYLLQIRNAGKEIRELLDNIDFLRYKASGAGAIRYDKDHVQTSPEDMVCEAIAEAIDLEQMMSRRIKRLQDMREHAEQVIEFWNNNNARFIEIYYLNHGSMSDVSSRIGCSSRHAYRIRDNALEEFCKHL